MTTLNHLNIVAHDVKATCINFEISKKLFYPFNFKGKFALGVLNTIHTPAINDALTVIYADAVGEYTVFTGKITKVTPSGTFYTIEATSDLIRAFNWYVTNEWTSATDHDQLMEDVLESTYGPGLTATHTGVATHNSISYFNVSNESCIDVLRRLVMMSADADGDPLSVFYQDPADLDGVIIEDYGVNVPGTDITISHANRTLLSKVTYDDTSQEIVNKVEARCGHGIETRIANDVAGLGTGSATDYGTRTLKMYRPEIFTQTDARFATDTLLCTYHDKNTRLKADVKHSQLDGRNYPVLNTVYTIIDASTSTTYTDVTCIEQTMRWPSFIDTCMFGMFFMSTGDYFLSQQGNSNNVENSYNYGTPDMLYAWFTGTPTQTITTSASPVLWAAEKYDLSSLYNTATGRYTVATTGRYVIDYSLVQSFVAGAETYYIYLCKNGDTTNPLSVGVIDTTGGASTMYTGKWDGPLVKGDYISVIWWQLLGTAGTPTIIVTNSFLKCQRTLSRT